MTAFRGRFNEWEQDKDGRWSRRDHPEDGFITVTPGGKYTDFADMFAQRAEPEPLRVDKIAELEARLTKLEEESKI